MANNPQVEKIMDELRKPFDPMDIKWRTQQAGLGNNGPWMIMVPYIDARAIQKRLDGVVGINGWRNEFERIDGGFMCGLSIRIDGEWVTKWDAGEDSNISPIKGGVSDAQKRAAAAWGVGRYLYQLDVAFASQCKQINSRREATHNYTSFKDKKSNQFVHVDYVEPMLPSWAMPQNDYSEYIDAITKADDMESLKVAFVTAYKASQAANNTQLEDQAVAAKDKRKRELIDIANAESQKEMSQVNHWLDEKIKDFSQHNISSTLNASYQNIKELLDGKVKGKSFDPKPLFQKLDAMYKSNLENLKK